MRLFFFKNTLFFLTVVFSRNLSAKELVIKFTSFEGPKCHFSLPDAGFFVDRISSVRGQTAIPWAKLVPTEFKRKRLSVAQNEIPAKADATELVFRFFALHDPYHADHYEAVARLDLDLYTQVERAGGHAQLSLKTVPTYQPEERRDCDLVLNFDILD